MAMTVEKAMKVARASLLLAALLAMNLTSPAAALATSVLHEAVLLGSLEVLILDFDVLPAGAGRPAAAPLSNMLALLGMGLLVLLGALILRRR